MGNYYPVQTTVVLFGSKSSALALTGVTLQSAYQTTEISSNPIKTFKVGGYIKCNLDISYTMGASETSNSIETKIEASPDGTNFYRLPAESTSGGTSTSTAREWTFVGSDAATATISIGLDIFYKWLRVSCKETGVATNKGTVFCEATLSGK